MHYLWIYVLFINLLAFATFGYDKDCARNGKRRISEKTLFTEAILGGSLGALLGMYIFHHKTRKTRFVWGIPIILGIQILIAYAIFH